MKEEIQPLPHTKKPKPFLSRFRSQNETKQDRQCKHIEARSPKQRCRGKAMIITYSEYVYVAYLPSTQSACAALRYTVIHGIFYSTIFFHIFSQTARFSRKKYWSKNACFDFLCHFALFLILRRSERHMVINVYWSSWKALVILDIFKLTLTLLTWRIGWAPNNASKWQMGFDLACKALNLNHLGKFSNNTQR
jgi:hypothetical protein